MSKQENQVVVAGPAAMTRRAKIAGIAIAAAAVSALVMVGCVTANEKDKVPTFNAEVGKALKFSGERVALVFAVDDMGRVQPYRAEGTKLIPFQSLTKQTLHAENILSFQALAVVKTSNPKICWPNGVGGTDCISW